MRGMRRCGALFVSVSSIAVHVPAAVRGAATKPATLAVQPVHEEHAIAAKQVADSSFDWKILSGAVDGANLGWTGSETVSVTEKGPAGEKRCAETCKTKVDANGNPCGGWVFNTDAHCYQKYRVPGKWQEGYTAPTKKLGERSCKGCSTAQDGEECCSAGILLPALGTHNSYHKTISPYTHGVMSALGLKSLADSLTYTHKPIAEQCADGLTTFEIDVYADPVGGRYSNASRPKSPLVGKLTLKDLGMGPAVPLETLPADYHGKMSQPGFKVFHIQDIDIQSHCLTLADCINELMNAKRIATTHVLLEVKTSTPQLPPLPHGLKVTPALEMTNALWAALEAEVQEAASASPPIKFLLDNPDKSMEYLQYVATKAGKTPVLVPNIAKMAEDQVGSTDGVYIKCNDATKSNCAFGLSAKQLVEKGYLVRSRTDSYPKWEPAKAKATLDSGAQIVHTDYPDKLKALITGMYDDDDDDDDGDDGDDVD